MEVTVNMELLEAVSNIYEHLFRWRRGRFYGESYTKIYTTGATVPLKIRPGHFATNHAHINYYIDVTTLKARTKEAEEVAQALVGMYLYDTVIDTIVCMEGTEVIGAFLAEELAKGGFLSTNAHKSIYVISPEFNNNSQIISVTT